MRFYMLSQTCFALPKFFLLRMLGGLGLLRLAAHAIEADSRADNARCAAISKARDAAAAREGEAWAKSVGWIK